MTDRLCVRILNPLTRRIFVIIPNIFPFLKRRLMKRGRTPEQAADEAINYNTKMSDANAGYTFEIGIGTMLSVFYSFVLTDIILILRHVIGKD
jgi:deoxyadenosine/deoxycytidine kinase